MIRRIIAWLIAPDPWDEELWDRRLRGMAIHSQLDWLLMMKREERHASYR